MSGRRFRHWRRLWSLVVATLLTLLVSGLPTFAAELIGEADVTCAADCDGSDADDKRCPPNCAYGACAKVVQAVPTACSVAIARPLESLDEPVRTASSVVPRDSVNEVFHPPRA